MRFWDSSAIVPLCVRQPASSVADRRFEEDSDLAVWWGTPVECVSALSRLRRSDDIDESSESKGRALLDALATTWIEIQPSVDLRDRALGLLRDHHLTVADSLQLAACLEWTGGDPRGAPFVTFDARLGVAARREGFEVLDTGGFAS